MTTTLDPWMRSILRCPSCHGEVRDAGDGTELICDTDGLAFPVTDGIPVMLLPRARSL